MIRSGFIIVAAIALGALGCGKGDKRAGSVAASAIDVDAVNALVPAELKDKLVFEKRDIVEERGRSATTYTVAAPKGWTQDMKSFATLKPEGGGFMVEFEVGTNCDGACEPKDWEKVVEKVYRSYLEGKVIKDEKAKGRRTIISEGSDGQYLNLIVAAWNDGDKNYATCGATLDGDLKAAAPAFEKACQAVAVSGGD